MKKKIILLVHDIYDARVIKRIKAFKSLGADLIVCGFSRNRYKNNDLFYKKMNLIFLGSTFDKKYFLRFISLLKAVITMAINLNVFKNCNCIYCINIDMLILGFLLNLRYNTNLYYEVGDILNAFIGYNPIKILFRKIESFLLIFTNLLILTSPAFYLSFYKSIQNYKGKWLLLENKLIPVDKPNINKNLVGNNEKFKIVYYGALRCQLSVDILFNLAADYNKICDLHFYGFYGCLKQRELEKYSKHKKNIFIHGEFKYPEDLELILSDADLLWLIDLSENRENAKLHLPNRLYDGIFYSVPMLAKKNTEAGRYIHKFNLGWCLGENVYSDLRKLFDDINIHDINLKKKNFIKIDDQQSCSLKQYKNIYNTI